MASGQRDKVDLFEVSSVTDIATEAVRQLDLAENARSKSKNIKGDLNNHMKMGIIIAKHAVYKLAERAAGMGDIDMVTKDRILTLTRERDDLQKEAEKLKRQLGTPSRREENRDEDWVTGKEELSTRSAARITRLRVTQARRKLISSSDSEGGGPGVVPPRPGVGLKKTKKVELVPLGERGSPGVSAMWASTCGNRKY